MRVIRDDPMRPSLVITNKRKFLAGLAEATAAMDRAVRLTEWRESWCPMLKAVRMSHIQSRKTREMFYDRRRDAAQRERIERRLEDIRYSEAQRKGRADAAAGRPLDQNLWETATSQVWEFYRFGYDHYLRERAG